MVEIQHNDAWSYEGNLGTPLGYAASRADFGNWTRAIRLASLLVGTRYTYEHEISSHVFPFTPIELHAGYLLGQERIITIHSGNYGWPNQACLAQSWHFDRVGKLTGREWTTTIGSEARTAVSLEEGEAIVLERVPVQVQPDSGIAEVRGLHYSTATLKFLLRAPSGASCRVSTGAVRILPHDRFKVRIGDISSSETAGADGTVVFHARTAELTEVSLEPIQ
jgi:hypothetical protein